MGLQVHANVLVTDTQVAFRSSVLGLFQQSLLQTCEADVRPILKAQPGRAKGPGVNFHREIAGLMGRVNHVKAVNSRSSRTIEPDILDVHVELPFSLSRPIRRLQPYAMPASGSAGSTLFRSLPLPEKVPIKSEPYSSATVFGSDSERSTRKAVTKLLRKSDGFNCLEVSQVAGKHFLRALLDMSGEAGGGFPSGPSTLSPGCCRQHELRWRLVRQSPRTGLRASGAADPTGGHGTIFPGGRIDQGQPLTASVGSTRKLPLVLHDQLEGSRQLIR